MYHAYKGRLSKISGLEVNKFPEPFGSRIIFRHGIYHLTANIWIVGKSISDDMPCGNIMDWL